VVNHEMLSQLGPPFGFSLWVAARVLLVHGSTIEKYVSQDIHFLIDTLRDLGRFWPVSARYCTILSRVVDEYQESQTTAFDHGNGTLELTPSISILADMRRCAYDLDVLLSRSIPMHGVASQSDTLVSGQEDSAISQAVPQLQPPRFPDNELEYLEAFDFFNYPRLPAPLVALPAGKVDPNLRFDVNGRFNITDFSVDASSDWLSTQ
jgi:hypothetical protein